MSALLLVSGDAMGMGLLGTASLVCSGSGVSCSFFFSFSSSSCSMFSSVSVTSSCCVCVCVGGGGDNIIALDNNNYTDSTNLETDIWIGFTAKSN